MDPCVPEEPDHSPPAGLTQEDLMSHVDRVVKALEKSGAADLVGLVRKIQAQVQPKVSTRIPFGLIAEPNDYGNVDIVQQPNTQCRLTHLVLTPDTARSYELTGFRAANIFLQEGISNIPLEPFSIEYLQSDRLATCMAWKSLLMTPSNRFSIFAHLREGAIPCQFRGIL